MIGFIGVHKDFFFHNVIIPQDNIIWIGKQFVIKG